MADDADSAQAEEERQRQRAIDGLRRDLLPTGDCFGRPDCQDCGFPIPPERKKIVPNATRCTECQTAFDKQQGHRVLKRNV